MEVAETLSSEGVVKEIGNLKLEIGRKLTSFKDPEDNLAISLFFDFNRIIYN